MKKLVFCAALFAAITFAACSDDDESNLPVTEANIVGTWQIVHAEGYGIDHDGKYTWSDDYPDVDDEGWYYWTYTFDERGTGTYTEYDNGESSGSDKFSYSISDSILTIEYEDEEVGIIERYRIDKLTKSQLVLFERSSYDHGDGGSWENTTTYERIK